MAFKGCDNCTQEHCDNPDAGALLGAQSCDKARPPMVFRAPIGDLLAKSGATSDDAATKFLAANGFDAQGNPLASALLDPAFAARMWESGVDLPQ